jgi:hypothetical protein
MSLAEADRSASETAHCSNTHLINPCNRSILWCVPPYCRVGDFMSENGAIVPRKAEVWGKLIRKQHSHNK